MPSAIVVGAGIFGASVAHRLASDGWEVTLVERDEPAGPRSTSGSHSRIIRCVHGEDAWHAQMARRARALWREIESDSGEELLVESGVVWLARREGSWETSGERVLRAEGIPVERLELDDAAKLFPSFDPAGLAFGLLEPQAGALLAERAVKTLVTLAVANGAQLMHAEARPSGPAVDIGSRTIEADHVIWACGPWLASLFAPIAQIRVYRVEYATFACGPEWQASRGVPTWAEVEGDVYGVPAIGSEGFKIAPGGELAPFDPDTIARPLTAEREAAARAYLRRRFPALADAPRLGGRVCQYEMTADTEFLVAEHPEHRGVWLVGGGSGHGFKHGPALAEHVRDLLTGAAEPLERHAAGRRPDGPQLTFGLGSETLRVSER